MIKAYSQIFIATFILEGFVTLIRICEGSVTHKCLRNVALESFCETLMLYVLHKICCICAVQMTLVKDFDTELLLF